MPVPSAPPAPATTTQTNASSRTRDLGVVILTNHCETRLPLGNGNSCAITPQVLRDSRLQLTLVLESRKNGGATGDLKVMSVTTRTNQSFEVDFGTMDLTLTPQIAAPPESRQP